jgi:hypothetical protein
MSARAVMTFLALLVSAIVCNVSAQHIAPSPLLTIDQNRTTVVDRIVVEWGDRVARSSAGLNSAQLREILSGLRADHLLAASLAGSVEGLRDVVSGALVHTDAAVSPALMHAKSLGDVRDDLVYTPIVPCRILDTRNGTTPPYNAPLMGGSAFPVAVNLTDFAPQGGSATDCGLPSTSFAAIAVTLTVLTPNFDAFLAASSSSDFVTLTQSVVMDFSANRGLANTAIVPVDVTGKFYLGLPAQVTTQVIADAVGYFRRPNSYGGTTTITGFASTVGGGYGNTAMGLQATVGGGNQNVASDNVSTVAGGELNIASAPASTVGGGDTNIASGFASTVPGGWTNTASGQYSFAAGYRAKASTDGSFIWADQRLFDFGPSVPNFFGVRATGGVGFTVAINPSTGAVTQFCNLLPGTPSWQCTSDRDAKENFIAADGKDILRRLVAMPLSSWSFKGTDPSIRSLGPTAQDFYKAFGLGSDNKMIANLNLEGVALAAIQGLHQTVRQQMRAKDKEIGQLKRKLEAIEARLGL